MAPGKPPALWLTALNGVGSPFNVYQNNWLCKEGLRYLSVEHTFDAVSIDFGRFKSMTREGGKLGRPFEAELKQLRNTYSFALALDVAHLSQLVLETLDRPVIAVGSGGSYTAASFVRLLHQNASGLPCTAITPLQVQNLDGFFSESVFWFLSARGKNKDIVNAAKAAEMLEPEAIVSLCAVVDSPLELIVKECSVGHGFSFKSPAGRDGYLATNSLLAMCIVLERAYSNAVGCKSRLPSTVEKLLNLETQSASELIGKYESQLQKVLARKVLLCLHGASTEVAAIDIESKITESALAYMQYTDFRNFAHGRHHWLSTFGQETGVISFVDASTDKLARRTIQQFPDWVEVATVRIENEQPVSQVEALVKGFFIIAALGRTRGVDPGMPGVAEFGSKLYHLSSLVQKERPNTAGAAIARKMSHAVERVDTELGDHLKQFVQKLRGARIGKIILDLDGTLLDRKDRYNQAPSPGICTELNRLAEQGVQFAVATGRSNGETSRGILKHSFDRHHWKNIVVGYCNGSDIRTLGSDKSIGTPTRLSGDVDGLIRLIKTSIEPLSKRVSISRNEFQVTVRPKDKDVSLRIFSLFHVASGCVSELGLHAKVLMSSHSIDIVSARSGKSRIERFLRCDEEYSVLKIGDMGLWPGNDYDLLLRGLGLSVDQVSATPHGCWNLLPRGVRGANGTIHYLRSLESSSHDTVSWNDEAFST